MQGLHWVEFILVLMPVQCQEMKAAAHTCTYRRLSAVHIYSSMRSENNCRDRQVKTQ